MPGLNTTGLANTSDYNLGRGKVYFAELDANGIPKSYRFMGNAPEFNISMETETLEHQSSTGGLKVTDKEVVISQKVNLSLTLDEINFQNMALFFSGSTGSHDNTAAQSAITGLGNLVVDTAGRWYDLYQTASGVPTSDSSGDRLYDVGTVTIDTLTVGDDFEVDSKMGRVFIKSNVTPGTFDVDVAADAQADSSVDEVRGLTQTSVQGALKFISENPAAGDAQTEYQFHQVSLKSEGDFGLISDEYTQMGLTAVAEANESAGGSTSPTLTIRTHAGA